MEHIKSFSRNTTNDRMRETLTTNAARDEIIRIMENLIKFDERYGRQVAVDLARNVYNVLAEANEVLEEFINDNTEETE